MENFQKNFITRPRVPSRATALGARDGPVVASGKKLAHGLLIHEKQIMDEMVLLHRSTGNYYSLNQTGIAIWQYCAESRQWEEILDFVSCEYQIEKILLEEEISSYLEELVQEGILEVL